MSIRCVLWPTVSRQISLCFLSFSWYPEPAWGIMKIMLHRANSWHLFWQTSFTVSAFRWTSLLVALLSTTYFHIPVNLLCSSHLFQRPVSATLETFPATIATAAVALQRLFQLMNPPAAALSTDLHGAAHGIANGHQTCPHTRVFLAPNSCCADLISGTWQHVWPLFQQCFLCG